MKEKSCELTHGGGPVDGIDSRALAVRDGARPLSAWWTAPGVDGLTMMSAMVEMNRLFFNYLFAYAGTQLRSDSVMRQAVFTIRWPGLN
jgi:hypothetical protein